VDEKRDGGTPSGGRAPATEDELRSEEQRAIAWFHLDAGRALESLADHSIRIGRRVESAGLDACREERRQLQKVTLLVCRLLELQFTDL
jgi:hypothetical protein